MLKQLSKLERTRKWFILGFAFLMAASLILFYAPNRGSIAEPAKSNEVLAKVGGDKITVGDLTQVKENYQQMFGGQISLAQLGGDKRLLDGLIRDHVVSQEAARLGLAASDAEVSEAIYKQFTDPSGKFMGQDDKAKGMERYRQVVTERYGDIAKFEQQIRDSRSAEKLQAYITAGVRVSPDEVQDDYKRKNTSFDLIYVPVTSDKLAQKIEPSNDEMRAYYDKHKTDYNILEPQKKIRYLYIDQTKVGETIKIPDADLHAEYDKLSTENKQAGVKAQQIVLKVARPDLDATVKAKADQLVKKARGEDGNATEAAFAELAKGNSEDPTSKNGGALTGLVKKDLKKADDPYQKVLDLQPGAVTDAIKYKEAYYILRRGDSVPKAFEDAKPELLVSQRNIKSYRVAQDLAAKALGRVKETKDLQKVAQEIAAEANMKPADMVKETPYIKPGDTVPDIGSSPQFEQAIAPLNNAGDIGERTPVKGGFAIPVLVDKKEPRIPEFDEVKDKVSQAVKLEKAKSELEQKAKELAQNTGKPEDLKGAAEKLGLQSATSDAYKVGSPLGEAGTSPALDEAIYNLKVGEVDKTPVKVGENWVVVAATKRTEADLAEFAKQRDQLTQSALSSKRNQVFEDFIAAAQERMKAEGKIKVYEDVLAKMQEEEPPPMAAQPRRAPRMPQIPTR
jgi:peptidyl-prolyl cis-trans isomerase D